MLPQWGHFSVAKYVPRSGSTPSPLPATGPLRSVHCRYHWRWQSSLPPQSMVPSIPPNYRRRMAYDLPSCGNKGNMAHSGKICRSSVCIENIEPWLRMLRRQEYLHSPFSIFQGSFKRAFLPLPTRSNIQHCNNLHKKIWFLYFTPQNDKTYCNKHITKQFSRWIRITWICSPYKHFVLT